MDELNIYEVGGSVRDRLLGRDPSDEDYVIVGHTVDEVVDAGFEIAVGESFPVFLHPETKDEYALARTEFSTGVRYKDFEFQTGPDVSLEEDLRRRDLTINAMARDPETGEIIDPYGGQEDLESGVVRHTSHAFSEDPLRVLRAARFSADLSFNVHPHTMCLCRKLAFRINSLSEERIMHEHRKALKGSDPYAYFMTLKEMNALPKFMRVMHKFPAGPEEYHKEGSVFDHTMMVLDNCYSYDLRIAALFHDIGKCATNVESWPHHHGHEKEGVTIIESGSHRLDLSNEEEAIAKDAARDHMKITEVLSMKESTLLDFVDRRGKGLSPGQLLDLHVADSMGRIPRQMPDVDAIEKRMTVAQWVNEEIGGHEVLERKDKEPGEWVGDAITEARVHALRAAENGHTINEAVEEGLSCI